jgi:rubredoxin
LHNDASKAEGGHLGILDFFRRRKKNFAVDDNDADRHHVDSLDYFEEKESHIHCPECAKAQKHVRLVETEGEDLECPECHYLHEIRRM